MKFSCSTAAWILLHPAIGLDNALCTDVEPPDWPMHGPLTCIALSQPRLSSSFSFCFRLHLFNFHPLSVSPSHCLLSQSHTLHLPSISLPPSLPFSSLPPILSTPTSPPTLSPRVQTAISRHSSTSRQLGPIRGGALTPASFDSRSSTC